MSTTFVCHFNAQAVLCLKHLDHSLVSCSQLLPLWLATVLGDRYPYAVACVLVLQEIPKQLASRAYALNTKDERPSLTPHYITCFDCVHQGTHMQNLAVVMCSGESVSA